MTDSAHPTNDIEFVEEYVVAAERFAIGIATCDLAAAVPACPTWSTYDIAVHLGNVHAWAATIVETGLQAADQNDEPASRLPAVVSAWYAGKAEDLYEVLRVADMDAPCWNATGAGLTAGFWQRRQTHETLMHLVDMDQASARTTDLSPTVSTDGIAEVLEVFLPRMHSRGYVAELSAPLTIRTLDTDHVWTLQPRSDGPPWVAVRSEPGADLIEGSAAGVWQLLWQRIEVPLEAVPVEEALAVSFVGNIDRIESFVTSRLTP